MSKQIIDGHYKLHPKGKIKFSSPTCDQVHVVSNKETLEQIATKCAQWIKICASNTSSRRDEH